MKGARFQMTAKSIRSFSAGIIFAASLCGVAYFFGSSEKEVTQTTEKLSEEKMKSLLTSKGYIVQTDEELQEQIAAAKAAKEKEVKDKIAKEKAKEQVSEGKSDKDKDKAEQEKPEKVIYRTMITVTSGMTSIDVGKALVRAKIIDNAQEFSNEVEKRGVSTKLHLGTYEIESGMKMDEIITTIFY